MDEFDEGVTLEDNEEVQSENSPSDEDQEETQGEESEASDEGAEDRENKTDRGTQVAKEPESQFYQQLKNQNADMRALLGDPQALKEYLRRVEGSQAPKNGEEDDLADLEAKVLTEDGKVDLKKLARYMDERTVKKIDEGIKYGLDNRISAERMRNTYESEKGNVRAEHPELDPKSKSYDSELERVVGERFIAQGGLQGKVSLKQVVQQTYAFIAKAQGRGEQRANQQIVRKKVGSINQGTHSAQEQEGNDEDLSPAEILAARVQKQVQGR